MTTEEILTILEELAENWGNILNDWTPDERAELRVFAERIRETLDTLCEEE